MEEEKKIESDRQRAEVFDALGHPTRIRILKALSEGSLGFADLKKKTAIESSGHLQHHLNKLNGLIKTDEYGKYCLSDQGKDALLTVQTVENVSSTRGTENLHKNLGRFNANASLKLVTLLLAAILIATSAIAVFEYNQAVALQMEISRFKEIDLEASAYYSEFGVIPTTNVNSSFSPPISMYRALQLGLQEGGWNKTSLSVMTVSANLMHYYARVNDLGAYNSGDWVRGALPESLYSLTVPPSDYSSVYSVGVLHSYVWQIIVDDAAAVQMQPPQEALIDAATGRILSIRYF
jgi:DNA-binding HxlR family transcriptional regulator